MNYSFLYGNFWGVLLSSKVNWKVELIKSKAFKLCFIFFFSSIMWGKIDRQCLLCIHYEILYLAYHFYFLCVWHNYIKTTGKLCHDMSFKHLLVFVWQSWIVDIVSPQTSLTQTGTLKKSKLIALLEHSFWLLKILYNP